MRASTTKTGRRAAGRKTKLIAFQHLAEKGLGRLEIQAALGIGRTTYYELRSALAELFEHNQDPGDDDE